MMDDISNYNRERWNALARANALFTRPALHLDASTARQKIDPEGLLGELAGKRVLCLASGGGQQSAAFALLGAHVTVCDLSDAQLDGTGKRQRIMGCPSKPFRVICAISHISPMLLSTWSGIPTPSTLCQKAAWFLERWLVSYATGACIISILPIPFSAGWSLRIGMATDIP